MLRNSVYLQIVAGFGILTLETRVTHSQSNYETGWYKADFWSGEYPHGFTVSAATTLKIRKEPVQTAAKLIGCELPIGATFHPWNKVRIKKSNLEFVAFTRIEEMVATKNFNSTVRKGSDGKEISLSLIKGDHWRSLAYESEGISLIQYRGKNYSVDQDFWSNSMKLVAQDPSLASAPDSGYQEWLKLTCENGLSGWIYMSDLEGVTTIESPNIVEYDDARDLNQ